MTLDLIEEEHYREYLGEQAKLKWGYPLNDKILNKIFKYTEYYPKYVNAICSSLWQSELEPSEEIVEKIWKDYIFSRKNGIREEISYLKNNEKKLLMHLSVNPTQEPYSQDFLSSINLSQASVKRALDSLLDKGLVVELDNIYKVIDPTYKNYFQLF